MRSFAFIFGCFLSCLALPLTAHELWIAPQQHQVASDGILTGDIVNGEDFQGQVLAFIPQWFAHFITVSSAGVVPVTGRIGDRPALSMATPADGLVVVAYQSRTSTLNYANWEKFQKFVDHKDLGDVLPRHQARGLPSGDFTESYTRFSKSLIGVGDGTGADRAVGMETEIVALTNPYTAAPGAAMQLQLLYKAAARANEQIEIFEKSPNGSVAIFMVRTNGSGVAVVPQKPGHRYMADAVVLREPSAQMASASGAVWETLWANLTWANPG